ncbi:myosin-binding striated muscle assembly central-domain-containing protein [Truncatella angustata]|uniref:Myosin-binding striated muscle assembly central-domain-containing protein n=1 Tax=Truncatella angustata TaxID=152316 RepID=A0A9P8UG66_9PEZI|nr:myosin-binding striated muscle assembly central-domain-containing protein [Truncatella angustata]KAH6651447.1 myosin-binding striated muscle assembly central-domain-containing protein [Truncatella angustata]
MAKLDNLEQAQLILARLMEGGQEDDDTCQALDQLTALLNKDMEAVKKDKSHNTICAIFDDVCVDTLLSYLDMRQATSVRGHAILATSSYLKAAGDNGGKALSHFFFDRVKRGTYDDYIVAFCVASSVFPVAPDMVADMFLSEGFLPSLGPLMRRKWKSRKVETACLEMLNAAAMNSLCREAIAKYCTEWLEEIVDQDPELAELVHAADTGVDTVHGSIAMKRHSEAVQNLAAVILAKLRAVPTTTEQQAEHEKIAPATTSIEDLSKRFTAILLTDNTEAHQYSVEGLAYATIQPTVKEEVARNKQVLKNLVKTLADAPPKSPLTYGALSIFLNITRYQPPQSEEEKKMNQLKAYANAGGKTGTPNPLNDESHVSARCKAVFEANLVPVLVTHSRNGSIASLSIIISIIYALSVTTSIRGQLAQQGSINLLIAAWTALPDTQAQAKRTAAQALARILISTNPALVFGGTRARPQSSAIRPLVSILAPDPAAETRDLLPSFEALMALTNLASTDDDTRVNIIRTAWSDIEDQLLSTNDMVSKAAVELVCNLVQCPEGIALYAEETPQARNRLHILLALADAESEGTRSAAGGALASLTSYEPVVKALLKRERGIQVVLELCAEENEDLRHRGVFVVYNILSCEGETGKAIREKIRNENGGEILKECAKKSRRAEVVEVTIQALKILSEENDSPQVWEVD